MPESIEIDGRHRRAEETRRTIIVVARQLIEETSDAPTAASVARRTGLSTRVIFKHFRDIESLLVAAVRSHIEELPQPAVQSPALPFDERVATWLERTADLCERSIAIRTAAGQFSLNPQLHALNVARIAFFRDRFTRVFAPELAALGPERSDEIVVSASATLSVEGWIGLRRRDRLGYDAAVAVWRRSLLALLSHGGEKDQR